MSWLWDVNPELIAIVAFAGVAGVGGWLHAAALALFGALGLTASLVLYLWERTCLVRLAYTRRLSQHRAEYGERVILESELVNDKLVPLPWVRVTDVVPEHLAFPGLSVHPREEGGRSLLQAFSLLPFQRSLRRIEVVCDRRGRHLFGGSEVRSGDPLGLRHRVEHLERAEELVVYPKIFAVPPLDLAARTPIGERRARSLLLADPSRIAGMRQYRPGDPLRHVDWRATARSGELLVRDFEATTNPRVAVFFDLDRRDDEVGEEAREHALSLAASFVVHFGEQDLPVGLYGPGLADGDPVAADPSSAPDAIGEMLELLALCEPDPQANLAGVLHVESRRLRRQALVLVISSRFSPTVLGVLAEVRRRAPVTALFVDAPGALAPPAGSVDAILRTERPTDWRRRDALALTE
jgi:uncharacterized protein (DUF58 family)